jgi:hypothetical protein
VDLAAIEAACSLRRRVHDDTVHFERIP